jgi:N-acetylneuraminate synthase
MLENYKVMNFKKISRPYLIAEAGINHNGDINIAKKIIFNAKKAGFDSVKFQKRDIDLVYSAKELDAHRESPWGKTNRDQKLGLEFKYDDYKIIDEFCKENKIEWFASPWDSRSIEFLNQFALKYTKVPSALIVNQKYLLAIAKN